MITSSPRIAVSADLARSEPGRSWGDVSLGLLDAHGFSWAATDTEDAVTVSQLESADALVIGSPVVRREDVADASAVPLLIARFGVGVDAVDLDACTERDIIVTNTPDGAQRPVAQAALALTLATTHHLAAKDALVRAGDWGSRLAWNGRSLAGSMVGVIGLGNIGSEFVRIVRPLGPRVQAFDPFQRDEVFAELGVARVDLARLLTTSDVIVILAPLTSDTFHLINRSNVGMIKRGAYLVNIARGEIVEHEALLEALESGRLAGAGLDVFEAEPLPAADALVAMPQVVLAPHSLAWTDEMARENGRSAVQAVIDVLHGRAPRFVVNRAVLERDSLRERLSAREPGRIAS